MNLPDYVTIEPAERVGAAAGQRNGKVNPKHHQVSGPDSLGFYTVVCHRTWLRGCVFDKPDKTWVWGTLIHDEIAVSSSSYPTKDEAISALLVKLRKGG